MGDGERRNYCFPLFQGVQGNRKDELVHKCSINQKAPKQETYRLEFFQVCIF